MLAKLSSFTESYHQALEAELTARGRENFGPFGEATRSTITYQGSDGFASFYFAPPPRASDYPSGHHTRDRRDNSLDFICRVSSLNRLKVLAARIGQSVAMPSVPPPDLEHVPEGAVPWMLHDDVARVILDRKLDHLLVLAVGPVVHFEGVIGQHVVPSRVRVWSPIISIPGVGERRLFTWTCADFWWRPEELEIDHVGAGQIASADLVALETALRHLQQFSINEATQVPNIAAQALEQDCHALLALLDERGNDEEAIHQWLNDPRHHLFLDPDAARVWSKLPSGTQVSDFVVQKSDQTYTLIEIEAATAQIFRKDNAEPSAPFNHACQQVKDWLRYVRDNVNTVRTELGLAAIYEPNGMVIIGRSKDMREEPQVRWRDLKNNSDFDVFTYDELCARVRNMASMLRRVLRGQ
jgi:hypothetical protein